ncbi:MAG: SMP-30/gluconolactonase/LRE family protein [Ruminococcus sp.]|nr:SMP-30/gluconolactonase/LRE family protein [Ruminococcus sp.]
MKTYTAVPFSPEKYRLGESPFYDPRTGALSWVDILAGKLYILSPDGRRREVSFDGELGAAVPCEEPGSYIAAGEKGLYLVDGDGMSLLCDLSEHYGAFRRSNDAKADPAGRLFVGSSAMGDNPPGGALFCREGDSIRVMQPDTKISNGMAWSRDRKHFYFSDSLFYAVFAYDYDLTSGDISGRRVLFNVEGGVPDGMCIDSEDGLWTAVWGGRRIEHRSSTDGSLLSVVEVPAEHVTSCCFMGEALDTLFITTSGEGLDGEYDGCLFTCKVDSTGLLLDYAKR